MIALFDFDGVVMNTELHYSRFWNSVGVRYLNRDDFNSLIKGQTLKHIFTYFESRDADKAAITEELNEFEVNMPYEEVPGAFKFIRSLRDAGIPVAVVTSSSAKKMENVYRHYPDFKELVGNIFTAENVTKSKPDPECFLTAMGRLGGTPQTTVIFEDSVNGLKAAKAAGAKVVGLLTSNPESVVANYADICINDFTHLSLDDVKKLF